MVAAINNNFGGRDDEGRKILIFDFTADARDSIMRIEELIDKNGERMTGCEDTMRASSEMRAIKSISMFLGLAEASAVSANMERTLKEIFFGTRAVSSESLKTCREGLILLSKLLPIE